MPIEYVPGEAASPMSSSAAEHGEALICSGYVDRIRAHIRQLNDDYTELTRSYVAIKVEMASMRTEIKWLKMLMVPIAIASLISAWSVVTG